jgi:hypothetical protein
MSTNVRRRDILKLLSVGGVVFASGLGLAGCAESAAAGAVPSGAPLPPLPLAPVRQEDFFFLQLSDTHWGFQGAPNPEAELTLKQTVAAINAVETKPDFIVFTGDLTHTTDDSKDRRARLAQFKEIVSELKVKTVRFLPGEHDASLDRGEAFVEAFGQTHYSFDHKGVHFVALDNVSEASGLIGDAQIEWLERDLAALPREAPIVILTHRPLFDLYPQWDWTTKDGARAIEVLAKRPNVTVFYGHIHQEHHQMTGAIAHHSARSLIFPMPAPGAAPKRAPLPWDPNSSDHGLGPRAVKVASGKPQASEIPFRRG